MNGSTVYMESPLGFLEIRASSKGVTEVKFVKNAGLEINGSPLTEEAVKQLKEYFDGQRRTFEVKLDIKGTDFQLKVWKGLMDIPYGHTWSYKELASYIDNPKAIRAVGGANNKNPVSILIPCHRVIGANGKLVGYGGGLEKKQWLLNHEKQNT